jgi:hypothetical protein
MKKSVVLDCKELSYLQTAVQRMMWCWQAQRDTRRPDADKQLEQYRRLYEKIARALPGQDDG